MSDASEDDDQVLERRLPYYRDDQVLTLWFRRITARGARALAATAFTQLRELSLYDNQIGAEGARVLAHAPWAASLQALNVCGNGLGAAGAAALAEGSWPALERLHIGFNELGDDGAVALASAHMPQLTTLNVRLNGIGARGASALIDRFASELRVLGIEENPLGPVGLTAIANGPFEHLEWLNFRETETDAWRDLCAAPWWPAFVRRNGKLIVDTNDKETCFETLARTFNRFTRPSRGVGNWAVQLEITDDTTCKRFVLTGNDWSVGRADYCHLSLPRTNLSKYHQHLYVRDGVLYLEDAGSTNGSFVNMRPVRGPVALSLDDRVNYSSRRASRMVAPPIPLSIPLDDASVGTGLPPVGR